MEKNIRFVTRKSIILSLIMTMLLSACQSSYFSSNSSVDSELTNSDSAQFFSKSGWQACAAGAGIAGIGCYLIKKDVKTCAIAAVISCGIAMGGNYYLDAKRAEYSNEEQRLDSYIEEIRQNTAQVKAVSDTAKKVLDRNLVTLKSLNKQIAENKVSTTDAEKQLANIDANLKYLNDKLVNMKQAEQSWRDVSRQEKDSGLNVAKLDIQIDQLNKQISMLEKQIDLVTQQRSALRVS